MLQRNLVTTKSAKNGGEYVGKPFDKIFFSSRFHLLKVLSQKTV